MADPVILAPDVKYKGLWATPDQLGDYSDSEYAVEACAVASFILWALSGRKYYGVSSITETYALAPVHLDAHQKLTFMSGFPLSGDAYRNAPVSSITLRHAPVRRVLSVHDYNGNPIDSDEYVLVDRNTISFPNFQIGTEFIVEYEYGSLPPVAGSMAARHLAQQFVMLYSDDEDCSLPANVSSVTRQGVTYSLLDNQDFIAEMRTGVYSVDLFLKSVNPGRAIMRAKVFSPDIPRGKKKYIN